MTHVKRINEKDYYETPDLLFDPINDVFHFTRDAAATMENTKCDKYFSDEAQNSALICSWKGERIWCNPPFNNKEAFLNRALVFRQYTEVIVFLVPAGSPETNWWRTYIWPHADEIIYLTPRVNYCINGKKVRGVAFPSCLIVYYPRLPGINGSPKISYWKWDQ